MLACGPRKLEQHLCREINAERKETKCRGSKGWLTLPHNMGGIYVQIFMPFELHEAGRCRRSRTIRFCVSRTCSFTQTIT